MSKSGWDIRDMKRERLQGVDSDLQKVGVQKVRVWLNYIVELCLGIYAGQGWRMKRRR